MSIPPERGSHQYKEYLLSKNPLTRVMTAPFSGQWTDEMRIASTPLAIELSERFGERWDAILGPLAIVAMSQNIFNRDLDFPTTLGFVSSVFLVGYEVGNMQDALLFSNDTLYRFMDGLDGMQLLERSSIHDKGDAGKVVEFFRAVVAAGAYIKSGGLDGNTGNLSIFKDFINDLEDSDG